MSDILFEPWVGKQFADGNRFGVRILVLGEAHYGKDCEARATVTIEVIRWLAQSIRHPFFTKVSKVLLGLGKDTWIDDNARAEVWEQVAFYNYIQGFVGNRARVRPSSEMWERAQGPFFEVLDKLRPQVVLVLGKELAWHLPPIAKDIEICRIQHPATGFSYDRWNPVFAEALRRAKEKAARGA